MKLKRKLFLKGFVPITLIALVIAIACNKSRQLTTNPVGKDSTVTLEQSDTLESGLILPAGSVLSVLAIQPKTIHISLPGAFRYMGTTTEGLALETQSLDITCTCTGGTGCNPFINSKASGCVNVGGCSVCTQTVTKGKSFSANLEANTTFTEGGIVDPGLGIRFITKSAEMQQTAPAFTAMLRDSMVIKALAKFLTPFQRDQLDQVRDTASSLPAGYRLMPISLYGLSLLVPVQEAITPACASTDIYPARNTANASINGDQEQSIADDYKCSCGAGTGCSKNSMWIPWVGTTYYCSSGVCTSCTLHVPD